MKIGVTGTRNAPTQKQLDAVRKFLNAAQTHCRTEDDFLELHHGDCVGADVAVAAIAKEFAIKTVCHPPSKDDLRAFFESNETRVPTSYFARDRNIVNETDFLIVVPWQTSPQKSGGTWYTHDYAIKQGKNVKIFYPENENV
jgi:hypothetical protein